jgi:hypothetical protein
MQGKNVRDRLNTPGKCAVGLSIREYTYAVGIVKSHVYNVNRCRLLKSREGRLPQSLKEGIAPPGILSLKNHFGRRNAMQPDKE